MFLGVVEFEYDGYFCFEYCIVLDPINQLKEVSRCRYGVVESGLKAMEEFTCSFIFGF